MALILDTDTTNETVDIVDTLLAQAKRTATKPKKEEAEDEEDDAPKKSNRGSKKSEDDDEENSKKKKNGILILKNLTYQNLRKEKQVKKMKMK